MTASQLSSERTTFSIRRSFAAPIEEVWALWTTREGIESWWGPEGFEVEVTEMDLRPGGELSYLMTAKAVVTAPFSLKDVALP